MWLRPFCNSGFYNRDNWWETFLAKIAKNCMNQYQHFGGKSWEFIKAKFIVYQGYIWNEQLMTVLRVMSAFFHITEKWSPFRHWSPVRDCKGTWLNINLPHTVLSNPLALYNDQTSLSHCGYWNTPTFRLLHQTKITTAFLVLRELYFILIMKHVPVNKNRYLIFVK